MSDGQQTQDRKGNRYLTRIQDPRARNYRKRVRDRARRERDDVPPVEEPPVKVRKKRSTTALVLLWSRRWLKTSKATEWISSATGGLTVAAGLFASYVIIFGGTLDMRRSEAEFRIMQANLERSKQQLDESKRDMRLVADGIRSSLTSEDPKKRPSEEEKAELLQEIRLLRQSLGAGSKPK